MIVDLAHVPLTQRRAEAPFNKLSDSPLPEDAVELQMPETAASEQSTEGNVSASLPTELPNHLPSDTPIPENSGGKPECEPQWNITTKDSEIDSNKDNTDETKDKTDASKSKPSASLPKLIIPEHDEIRKRR